MSLVDGKVLFSDRFVKPNYSAKLSDWTGKLSAVSSVSPTGTPNMADLELRGRAEGTASLEILGKLNPLAKPLALDINGKVRDLDLSKPRNLLGLAKGLPVADMEKLLLADIKVGDDAMRELALQRAVAVKDYLAAKDLPLERLFLGAAKTVPPEAKWTPRAEQNLATP